MFYIIQLGKNDYVGHLEHHGWIAVLEKEKAYKFKSHLLSDLVESYEKDLKEHGYFELEDIDGIIEYERYQVLESEIVTKRVVPISEILNKS